MTAFNLAGDNFSVVVHLQEAVAQTQNDDLYHSCFAATIVFHHSAVVYSDK